MKSSEFKSNFTFECDSLGAVGFQTTVDLLRHVEVDKFEICSVALCFSQKMSVDALYDDGLILALQDGFNY